MPLAGDEIFATDVAVRINETPMSADSATYTTTEVSLFTVSGSLVSGWRYRITARFWVATTTTTAPDVSTMRLREDTVAGTQFVAEPVQITTTLGTGWSATVIAEYTAVSTAAKTFVLTGQRTVGSGTHKIALGAARLGLFTIDRIVS